MTTYMNYIDAVEAGNLTELKRIHELKRGEYRNGFNSSLTNLAALRGHLDCLMYLRAEGCDWTYITSRNAAEGGHLACLIYAHENGCDWNEQVVLAAAQHGHLECLRYTYENGCKWPLNVASIAAQYGHADCFRYCLEVSTNKAEFLKGTSLRLNGQHISYHKYKLDNIVEHIRFSKGQWQDLLIFDLSDYPLLDRKVKEYKEYLVYIEKQQELIMKELEGYMGKDVIKHIIYPCLEIEGY
jgi:hypothetical protein